MSVVDDFSFPSVNRSMLLLNRKQPYADWANNLPDRNDLEKERPLTIEDLNHEVTGYLILEIMDDYDLEAYIEHAWILLFELQLSGWTTDDKLWPKKRTLKMFNDWFEVKCSSLIIDLWEKDPLDYSE